MTGNGFDDVKWRWWRGFDESEPIWKGGLQRMSTKGAVLLWSRSVNHNEM